MTNQLFWLRLFPQIWTSDTQMIHKKLKTVPKELTAINAHILKNFLALQFATLHTNCSLLCTICMQYLHYFLFQLCNSEQLWYKRCLKVNKV